MRRPEGDDVRSVDNEVVVDVQVAEVDRQLLARARLDLEEVAAEPLDV